jgi:beta-lactam-binding protein with PASTA domain
MPYGDITEEYDESIPQDSLIAQDPAPGVASGRVRLVFSKGSVNEIIIPGGDGFIGLTYDEAVEIRDPSLGLSWSKGAHDDYSDTVAEGRIVWQSVPPGTAVPRSTKIEIGLSLGPMPTMPDLIGLSKEDAWQAYFDAGFRYINLKNQDQYQYSDSIPAGQILDQLPAAGTRCDPRHTSAEFIYSLGPDPEAASDQQG